jgi:patatin-like phospholipase/acyl hydrolase
MSSFQILALDGGGIKGLFSAAVLTHLEEDLQINVTDYFDLIVGTSTGGIIALGLGIGMRPREIVSFYVKKGHEIFPRGVGFSLRQFWRNKFNASPLENALKEFFNDKLLGESRKRLVIPSYNLGDDDVYLFKTAHHERLKRDYKVPIWKVALATSAAPTYFPSFRRVNHIRLIDGGIWANNPTMVGIVEAVSMLGQSLDSIKVLSLGTTDEIKIRPAKLDKGGFWQWKKAALDVFLRAQNIGTFTQALHLLGEGKVIRLNPKVPDGLFAMDKLSEKELLSKAAHESRHFTPKFKKDFMEHIAPVFTSMHPKENKED